jgi:hypothetical protein
VAAAIRRFTSRSSSCYRSHGTVLTEHFGDPALTDAGESLDDRFIHDRDIAWLRQADVLVAEVTTPSLGVGYEIGPRPRMGQTRGVSLPAFRGSAAIGNDRRLRCVEVYRYNDAAQLPSILKTAIPR